jgi:hypothetical protein
VIFAPYPAQNLQFDRISICFYWKMGGSVVRPRRFKKSGKCARMAGMKPTPRGRFIGRDGPLLSRALGAVWGDYPAAPCVGNKLNRLKKCFESGPARFGAGNDAEGVLGSRA